MGGANKVLEHRTRDELDEDSNLTVDIDLISRLLPVR